MQPPWFMLCLERPHFFAEKHKAPEASHVLRGLVFIFLQPEQGQQAVPQ